MMKVGIAYSHDPDALEKGRYVAQTAMVEGSVQRVDLAIAFCSADTDHDEFVKGLRLVVGGTPPIIGGSAIGIITHSGLSYNEGAAGVMLIESDKLTFKVHSVGHIDQNEALAGQSLAERFPDNDLARLLLIFYDSIQRPATADTPPIMNASPPLLQGIESKLAPNVPIFGAGLLGSFEFGPTLQFCGHHVAQQSVVGLAIHGDVKIYSRIMHGCTPQDGVYHTITRAEGAVVYEVDGRPIVDWIDEMYGHQDWQKQMPVKRLTIGVNGGEKFGLFDENNFVNRLISGVLPDRDGIVLFEPDLPAGSEILFMLRDADAMIRSAQKNTTQLLDQMAADNAQPLCAFYIDCAGRAASFSETLEEEADQIINELSKHQIPLFGFYSGVEVAPLQGCSRGLDWTGVLMILAI